MIKLLELFGGIGAPRRALERQNIDFETVDYVEIDKFAVKSYNAMYNETYQPQDIRDWDKNIEVDMIFHGSPCQDFSLAGNQAGGEKDSGTRSSLLWETIRIVTKLKPKYVLWENVKNTLSKKHKPVFDKYLDTLKNLGYTNYYKVLNTKDYGLPQNRERVFCISVMNDSSEFNFPEPFELNLKLSDLLEDEIDQKYFLSDKMIKYITAKNEKWTGNNNGAIINKKIASTINTGEGTRRCDASNYFSEQVSNEFDLQSNDSKNLKIRKLTPKECWRLQGFDDSLFKKAESVCSNTQLYKQAGNSITVNVLEYIFISLFNLDQRDDLIHYYVILKELNQIETCKDIISEIKHYTSKEYFLNIIKDFKQTKQYNYLKEVI